MKKVIVLLVLVVGMNCTKGQWTFSSLSVPTDYMGATVLGSKAYFAGGEDCINLLSVVEIYDIQTGLWNTSNNLSVARELPFATTCGSKIFFAGGVDFYISGAVFSTIDIYDTVTQEWSVKQLSIPRLQAAIVSHGNKVLFAGGTNYSQGIWYDIVDIYNVETEEWSTATLSEPRVVWWTKVGDLAIFAGGYNAQQSSKRVDIYNFTTDTWSIDSLSVPRAFIGVTTIGNKVLFAGGMVSGNTATDIVDIYDATTGTWSTANLSLARAFADNQQAVTACGKAFFVGGGKIHLTQGYWTAAYQVIDIYDYATNTWSVDTMPIAKRVHHAVVAVEDKVIIAGGYLMDPPYGCDAAVAIYTCPSPSCLPEGITFTTQEEIDNFQTNYPGCTEIEGFVAINGNEITDLNGLNNVTQIGGHLIIGGPIGANNALTSLTGLENLTSIGGDFTVMDNPVLTGLEGLENLTTISGNLTIGDYDDIACIGNPSMNSLAGLTNLTNLGGGLYIGCNNSLINIDGLINLNSIGGNLFINENSSLVSITGLNNLTEIGGGIYIGLPLGTEDGGNDYLTSLSGLNSIEPGSIDMLQISNNDLLSNCDAISICEYLANPSGVIEIHDNAPGCNSMVEVEEACANTSIKEKITDNIISVIPNPSKDKITISSPSINEITNLSIFNVSGEKVMERQLTETETQLDISALPRGVYFVRVQNEKMVEVGKVVKE